MTLMDIWCLSPHGYLLSWKKYIIELILYIDLSDNTIADTLMQLHQKLIPNMDEPLANPTHYRELIGALVYITISRHNITYVVHIVSQLFKPPHQSIMLHFFALSDICAALLGERSSFQNHLL